MRKSLRGLDGKRWREEEKEERRGGKEWWEVGEREKGRGVGVTVKEGIDGKRK